MFNKTFLPFVFFKDKTIIFVFNWIKMNILIKNGTLISPESTVYSDVFIREGMIEAIGQNIPVPDSSCEIIDASGCFLLPGAIDPHVHLNLPASPGFSSDDFISGSKAALLGGTTSIIDFVTPKRGQSVHTAFIERKKEAAKSLIDYKLHVSPVEWLPRTAEELEQCFYHEGVRSFKIYMAYKSSIGINDGAMLQVMKTVARLGGLVTVHCEMGNEIDILRDQYFKSGKTSVKYHALSRPSDMEAMAVKRAIDLAKRAECPLYIVHVSSGLSLEHIRKAQSGLQPVFAETCPQYLLFTDKKYRGNFEETAPYVMSPPLRKKADNLALWQALADGTIQTIGTDHCPFNLEQKKAGLSDFRKIPNGAGGIEHRLELLYSYGVLKKKLSINRLIELISTQPAKIFGLFPHKGIISPGSDADIVVWDPEPARFISANSHHQNSDINIYEGIKIMGQAKYVLSKGIIAVKNGKLVSKSKGFYIL
jgi:dihydropyrimidinase